MAVSWLTLHTVFTLRVRPAVLQPPGGGRGVPTRPPGRTVEPGQLEALAELMILCVLAVAGCLIADTGRILLDRRRLAAWEKEWRATGLLLDPPALTG